MAPTPNDKHHTPENSEQPQQNRSPQEPALTTPPWRKTYDTPFLSQWKTDLLFSVIGLSLRIMIAWTIMNLTGALELAAGALETGTFAFPTSYIVCSALFDILCAFVAFTQVNRRFMASYEGTNYLVSCVNMLVGGLLFGSWWNWRLTKRVPGISCFVFVILMTTNGISSILMVLIG